jgi:hypothetical protein
MIKSKCDDKNYVPTSTTPYKPRGYRYCKQYQPKGEVLFGTVDQLTKLNQSNWPT